MIAAATVAALPGSTGTLACFAVQSAQALYSRPPNAQVSSGYLIKLNQNLHPNISRHQKKINTSIIRPRPRRRINRRQTEVFLHKRRSAIHIQAAIFHLLDPFAKPLQKPSDRSLSVKIAGR